MSKLSAFLRKLRLRQILTVFLAGVLLFVSTACNSGDARGARPENPPVQLGGNNNPHKGGGDGYTNYKMSTDPKVKSQTPSKGDRADLNLLGNQLIAASNVESNASDLLYPGSDATNSRNPDIGPVGGEGQKALQESAQRIPAQRQPVIDRSDPNTQILEKVGQQFQDASSFLKDTRDSALDQPEMQVNPAKHKR